MPHEPKKKHSKAVKRIRRASIRLEAANLIVCKNCKEKTLAHMACRSCGFYAGKQTREIKQKAIVTRAN
ncbi:50S ribosomal protein L32 [Candidatus Daviesbacteria bacterium]|nr:50S ribosomal protein L32 [Candidatus Daviesbacteria bacterium]